MRETLEIDVGDICPSNLGVSASGHVGMRDLGRCKMPRAMLDRVRSPDFPRVPDAVLDEVPGGPSAP